MSTSPITLPAPEPPDADVATILARVLALLAIEAPTWTDHNAPEPGITLLESAALGLADVHHRLARVSLRGWPLADLDPGPAGHLSGALPAEGLLDLARTLTDVTDGLAPLLRAARSRADAEAVLTSAPWSARVPPAQREDVVRLLRAPLVLRAALERTDAVAAAVDAADSLPGPTADGREDAALGHLIDLGLWAGELRTLVRRERRRRTVAAVDRLRDRLAAGRPADRAALDAELAAAGLAPEELTLAHALAPLPRTAGGDVLPPEGLEGADGAAMLWPTHGIQALTCEPVTGEDYARRARTHPGVGRAWTVTGRLPGVAWHGLPVLPAGSLPSGDPRHAWAADPAAPALTVVVERTDEGGDDEEFLREVLRHAIGPEAGAPFRPAEDRADGAPRRVVCDEVGAALLRRVEVHLDATVVTVSSAHPRGLRAGVRQRVAGLLTGGRAESRPTAAHGQGLDGRVADGPWPPAPQPPLGWLPGEAIRVSELVERIVADPDVLGVREISVRAGGPAVTDPTGTVPVPPGTVPVLADPVCLTVVATDQPGWSS